MSGELGGRKGQDPRFDFQALKACLEELILIQSELESILKGEAAGAQLEGLLERRAQKGRKLSELTGQERMAALPDGAESMEFLKAIAELQTRLVRGEERLLKKLADLLPKGPPSYRKGTGGSKSGQWLG
jgi:hypothetical protein